VLVHNEKWYWWQPENRAMSPNGEIYARGLSYSCDYSSVPNGQYDLLDTQAMFVHEMTHVWQSQSGVNMILNGLNRRYDYNFTQLGTIAFTQYGIEQQAQLVQDYFSLLNGRKRVDKRGNRMPSLQQCYEVISPYLPLSP
jgi:hypothetical protein